MKKEGRIYPHTIIQNLEREIGMRLTSVQYESIYNILDAWQQQVIERCFDRIHAPKTNNND